MTFVNKTYEKSPFQIIEVNTTTSDEVSNELTWDTTAYNFNVTSANQKFLIIRRFEATPATNTTLDVIQNNNGSKTFFNGTNTYVKANGELYTVGVGDYGTTQSNISNTVSHSVIEATTNYTKKLYTLMRIN